MLRRHCFLPAGHNISPVQIRARITQADLAPTPRYAPIFKQRLSRRFDVVMEQNRFESLRVILGRMSGHVGRRQYALQHDLNSLFFEKFRQLGLDWHELMALPPQVLLHVLEKQIGMTPSQRRVFMTAVHCRICGVLTEGATRSPDVVCMNRGLAEHGYRCGKKGHVARVYFEGKKPRTRNDEIGSNALHNIAALTASAMAASNKNRNSSSSTSSSSNVSKSLLSDTAATKISAAAADATSRTTSATGQQHEDGIPHVKAEFTTAEDSKVKVRVSTTPDFRIVGRLFHEAHPRTWSTPTSPSFDVAIVGYEFYMHPSDARARPQIAENAADWMLHAEALRHVVWELLELQAIERVHPVSSSSSSFMFVGSSGKSATRMNLALSAHHQQLQRQQQQQQQRMKSDLLLAPFQPFELRRGDVRSERDVLDALRAYYTTVDQETGVIIENCMSLGDDADDDHHHLHGSGGQHHQQQQQQRLRNVVPWFVPSDPRPLNADGVPPHFPLAPSIAVQCLYRRPEDDSNSFAKRQQQQQNLVSPPFLEFRCFFHNKACFSWPTPESKSKAVSEILGIARRVPFALPFTLYFRVDSSTELAKNAGALRKERNRLLDAKRRFFDLTRFCDYGDDDDHDCGDTDFHSKRTKTQQGEEMKETVIEVEPEKKSPSKGEVDEMEALIRSLNPDGWADEEDTVKRE